MTQERTNARLRGFAGMDADKRRAIAKKGGASVPREKRSFVQNPALAAQAGRKGGLAVPAAARSFSFNRDLASKRVAKVVRLAKLKRRRRLKRQ